MGRLEIELLCENYTKPQLAWIILEALEIIRRLKDE
jgi:hypothetical protein